MLVRNRLSRIYYLRRFFDYPIKLNAAHDRQSRPAAHASGSGASYARARAVPASAGA